MGLFSKPQKRQWGVMDHIGHACTRYGMFITRNITIEDDDPLKIQIGNNFQSVVDWLVHYKVAGASDYYQAMFELGCINKKFTATWTPAQVTKAKDKYLHEAEQVKDSLIRYMDGSSKEEEVTRSLIRAMGKSPDKKGSLDEIEESWLNAVNVITLELCDQQKKGDIGDDPVQGAITTFFLGCLVISCYREYKN
jgi:hypothetical protein